MTYLLMHVNLTAVPPEEAAAFFKEADSLGLDVIDLSPPLAVDPETTVLISTSLAALLTKLAELGGGDAAERLWNLLRRLLCRTEPKQAIEDRERRVTFVWDDHAIEAGPVAVAAMIDVGAVMSAIPDGTALTWNPDALQWQAEAP
jgi:hypothetical protein